MAANKRDPGSALAGCTVRRALATALNSAVLNTTRLSTSSLHAPRAIRSSRLSRFLARFQTRRHIPSTRPLVPRTGAAFGARARLAAARARSKERRVAIDHRQSIKITGAKGGQVLRGDRLGCVVVARHRGAQDADALWRSTGDPLGRGATCLISPYGFERGTRTEP
jgi:hypothetical protein